MVHAVAAPKYITVQITRKGGPSEREAAAPDGASATQTAGAADAGAGKDVCKSCGKPLTKETLAASLWVCPHCDHHYPMGSPERISLLADAGTWREIGGDLRPTDPLDFFDTRAYTERLAEAQVQTGLSEAFVGGLCDLSGRPVALGVMDFRFMGGSMGSVVGERFARLSAAAALESRPFVIVVASGGARMQEGILSLMQMAKTVVALDALAADNLPFVTVLTNPTTGGVLASFAMLADVAIAEPGALLCFAGPRVIEQTTHEKLPEGFGRSEANQANGQIDMIVHRRHQKATVTRVLDLLEGGVRTSAEPLREDTEVVPRRSRPFARAVARAKKFAVAPRRWLRGRDTEDPGKS